jgi:protein-disulfide isomerase/uncharacterized membrane protein
MARRQALESRNRRSVNRSLTLNGLSWPRLLSFASGIGMAAFALLTVEHYFAANYPSGIFEGSFCDISAFFNCDSSAYSPISALWGIPIGFFGLILGGMVALGAAFPSESFERTNKTLSLLNILCVVGLLVYSVVYLGSLCLLCGGFYAFSLLNYLLFWRYGRDRDGGLRRRWLSPSAKLLATALVFAAVGGWGVAEYHEARREAQSGGAAARAVEQFYSLEPVPWPSFVSPFWTARSTERFDEAPIRIVEYADLLCPDCRFLHEQLQKLKAEFAGKLNIAFQFFPLEARCNDVVDKDLHPGACELSYVAAYDPDLFLEIHDEIFANFRTAKESAEWRRELSRRHGVEAAVGDSVTQALVHRIIETGREYGRTSAEFAHGIRSTPTMIINNRMIIGTLPYEQLRAIFRALVDEAEDADRRFMESWEETG